MTESEFIAALRALPLHPGARGLLDDAAVIGRQVFTLDTLVEGVHFLASDPPGDVAWKLLAVNLSDLAAKGAEPTGALLSYPLGDDDWDRAFLAGLADACKAFACPLLGGDTVRPPSVSTRVLTLTAIGTAEVAPSRTGAQPGDALWVTGTIGDGGAGLVIAQGAEGPAALLERYRRPAPRLAEGRVLAARVHAMSDVSDGLLIDAARMATASGLAVAVDIAAVPLSVAYRAYVGDDCAARLSAATAGDDYELLFALPKDQTPAAAATRVGHFRPGSGLTLTDDGTPLPVPARLGFLH